MIRIDSIKQLDADNFEVEFVLDGHAQTKRFEYTRGSTTDIGVINSSEADGPSDDEFHEFLGANREFLTELFRLAKKVIGNKPLDLPIEVEEGWPNFRSR